MMQNPQIPQNKTNYYHNPHKKQHCIFMHVKSICLLIGYSMVMHLNSNTV